MMSEKRLYTDASCNRQYQIASWAVIDGEEHYTGLIHGENLRSSYCELYAINEALKIADNCNAIIYNDNTCTNLLNREKEHIEKKINHSGFKDKQMLKEVYDLYCSSPNVKIKKASRKTVMIADYLARKTLKGAIKNIKRSDKNE